MATNISWRKPMVVGCWWANITYLVGLPEKRYIRVLCRPHLPILDCQKFEFIHWLWPTTVIPDCARRTGLRI